MKPTKRFRVAFSFAGEKRDYVAQVAALLAKKFGESAVLYDNYHEAEFARARLGRYLPKLYNEQSDLIVVVICPDYSKKEWCGLEWDAIFDLLKKRREDEVMLANFDYASVDGLYSDAGFINLDRKTPEQTATLILERLALTEGKPKDHYTCPLGLSDQASASVAYLPVQVTALAPSQNEPAASFLGSAVEIIHRLTGINLRGVSERDHDPDLTPLQISFPAPLPTGEGAKPPRIEYDFSQVAPLGPAIVRKALAYRSYDADRPPEVFAWVGRTEHLSLLQQWQSGVVAITGIGGQGKSALAAKALDLWRTRLPELFWDWRDCREEGERLPTQLASILSRVTHNSLNVNSLASASTADVCRLFFRLLQDSEGVLVFDNVDHYVDVESGTFTGPLHTFVLEALRTRTRFRIVLTCRPRVSYADIAFREIPVHGLGDAEALSLFRQRGVSAQRATDVQVGEIHRLTRGHPFWLTMLAAEFERKSVVTEELIDQLRAGELEDDQIVAMLRPVWNTLVDRERVILSVLSECTRPLPEIRIERLVSEQVKPGNQFRRTLSSVTSLGLVIRKSYSEDEPIFELHPVVRGYLRKRFALNDRKPFLQMISEGTKAFLTQISTTNGFMALNIETYELATLNIESLIQAGQAVAAARSAFDVTDRFVARGLLNEYVRLGLEIVERFPWEELENTDFEFLHNFLRDFVLRLAEADHEVDARKLIAKYRPHLHAGTVMRIRWFTAMCRMEWLLGNFEEAIKQGRKGVTLKTSSNIDTDADAESTLLLAIRDSGQVEEALRHFSGGANLTELVATEDKTVGSRHSFYGNIGRCLYLQGDLELAIRFYARSWHPLDGTEDPVSIENRGWAALWLGEAFLAQGHFERAALFFAVVRDVWRFRLPMKLALVNTAMQRLPSDTPIPPADAADRTAIACDEVVFSLRSK